MAAQYDIDEIAQAVEHAARLGKTDTVLVTIP